MALVLIASLVWAISLVINRWRRLALRQAEWDLYALRDRLRWRAIDNGEFRRSAAFTMMDRTASGLLRFLPNLSIWSLLAAVIVDDTDRKPATPLDLDEEARKMLLEGGGIFLRAIALRHFAFIALLGLTGVGAVAMLVMWRRANALLQKVLASGFLPNRAFRFAT